MSDNKEQEKKALAKSARHEALAIGKRVNDFLAVDPYHNENACVLNSYALNSFVNLLSQKPLTHCYDTLNDAKNYAISHVNFVEYAILNLYNSKYQNDKIEFVNFYLKFLHDIKSCLYNYHINQYLRALAIEE